MNRTWCAFWMYMEVRLKWRNTVNRERKGEHEGCYKTEKYVSNSAPQRVRNVGFPRRKWVMLVIEITDPTRHKPAFCGKGQTFCYAENGIFMLNWDLKIVKWPTKWRKIVFPGLKFKCFNLHWSRGWYNDTLPEFTEWKANFEWYSPKDCNNFPSNFLPT